MSVPQVTVKSETIDPRVMRRFEASMAGQLSTTVPLVGITASIRVDGAKLEVDVEDEVAEPEVAVAVTVTVDVAVGVVAVLRLCQFVILEHKRIDPTASTSVRPYRPLLQFRDQLPARQQSLLQPGKIV